MLCKIPGNFELERMRVVQLIAANVNMYLRLRWGKRLARNIIDTNKFLVSSVQVSGVSDEVSGWTEVVVVHLLVILESVAVLRFR